MDGSCFGGWKPIMAMVVVQFIYAAMALLAKEAFKEGFSSKVFVVYRQAIATIVLLPPAIIQAKRGRTAQRALGLKGFSLVFAAALFGATVNQFLYYKGLDMSSPSMSTAMTNLTPGITFLMAAFIGLETVKLRSLRSMAKILGTIICVGGAMCMAMFKGPKLLNMDITTLISILHSSGTEDWILGCIFLLASSCCWSFWLILQVPICKNYLDPLSLAAWMCFLSTLQSAIITFFLEPELEAWKINSLFKLFCCVFTGIFGSGVTYYIQSWSIAIRGPLFSALFNPLSTVIATVFSSLLLHEELHVGSLVGVAATIGGLYVVLWGKDKEFNAKTEEDTQDPPTSIAIRIDAQQGGADGTQLDKPLLDKPENDIGSDQRRS